MVDRIKQVVEYTQMSTKAFADTIKLNPSSLTHIFNGRNQPSLDVVKKILTAFPEVNSEWLIMGVGKMLNDVNASAPSVAEVTYSTVDNMQQADLFSAMELEAITPVPAEPTVEEPEEELESEPEPVPVSTPAPAPVYEEPQPVVRPVAQTAPVAVQMSVPRVVAPVVETPAPVATPKRGRNADSHNSGRESKRDRISNSQSDKKLVKIVMFYDDRSFEEYFPN